MDKMNIKDIFLVGVPNVYILLLYGIYLYRNDYFKNIKISTILLKSIVSIVFILWSLTYIRAMLQNILYIGLMSLTLYMLALIFIWKLNIRSALFCSIMIVFLSSSIEDIFTPLFLKLSQTSNIFTQSRFMMFLPIGVTQIFIILLVRLSKINVGDIYLFKSKWKDMTLSNKITTVLLIMFALTGFVIACSYTDILIKVSVFKLDISEISNSISYMFYGVLLLISSGLLIISRTRNYEEQKQELKDIKDAFNIPKEKLFLNILRASKAEDIPKFHKILTNYIREVKNDEKE